MSFFFLFKLSWDLNLRWFLKLSKHFYCGKCFVLTVAKTAYTHVPVNEQLSVLSSILTVFVVQSTCFDFVRSEEKFVITIP